MVIELTDMDLQDLIAQAEQQGEQIYQQTKSEIKENLPKELGDGGERLINLRGGLTIHVCNFTLCQTTRLEQQHEAVFPLTAKFYLSGSSRVKTRGISDIQSDYEETAGCHYLY